MTTAWASWVQLQLDRRNWRPADAARASGVNGSIISRWVAGKMEPSKETMRKFAEAADIPILEVLLAAGYLTPGEAKVRPSVGTTLSEATDIQLATELLQRMSRRNTSRPPLEGRIERNVPDPDAQETETE